jgi:phage terminase small subunit
MSEKKELRDIPEPQSFVVDGARIFYLQICEHLIENNMIKEIDSMILSSFAMTMMMHSKMALLIGDGNLHHLIQTYDSGAKQVTPEFTIFMKTSDKLDKFYAQLGIGPKNRESIEAFVSKGVEDEEAEDDIGNKRRIK